MNTFRITTISLATAALLAGCIDYELTYDGTQMSLPEGVFDYSLTSVNNVNIDLGEYGRQTHLEFFTEDPSKNRSALPIYSIFTDNEGRFSADVNLPNGYDKIYLHTRTEFVPHVVALDVKNGTISYTFNGEGTTRAMAATRAAGGERTIYLNGCSASNMYVYLYQEDADPLMSWDDAISDNYKMKGGGGNWYYTIPSSFSSADMLIFRSTDNGGWQEPKKGGYPIVEDGVYTTSGLQSINGVSTQGWYADRIAVGSGSNSIYNLKADDSDKESDDFNIYSLCQWDRSNYYGKVDTPSDYFGKSDITATQWNDLKKRIRKAFWGDENAHTRPAVTEFKKDASKDNSGKAVDTDHLNITIASTTTVDGKVVPVENAEVYFTFLTENGWNQNTIGYYYYTGDAPTDPTAVKRFIILPNASIANDWDENNDENLDRLNMPYVLSDIKDEAYYINRNEWSYRRSNAPVAENKKIKLLYWKDGEQPTTKFPAGTTIGFFIISNGFGNAYDEAHNKGLNLYRSWQGSKGYLYSNKDWNKIGNGNFYDFDGDLSNTSESSVVAGGARFATLNDKLGVVVGVEDGTDCSFEDDVFLISSNVHGVLEDPHRPDLEYPKSDTKTGTLLYEDIWAGGGDYDMNDVVVNYTRTINYNEDNSVNYIEDVFVPYVGLDKYADYEDGFGYVVADDYAPGKAGITTTMLKNGVVATSDDVYYEEGSKSIILFKNQHAVQGFTYTIKREFTASPKPQKTAIEEAEFNGVKWDPFIISKGDENGYKQGRIEIHIPGRPETSYAKSVDAITHHFYTNYIDGEKGFPFSLNLPISNFEVSPEGVIITDTYPQFAKWVDAGNVDTEDYTVKWNNKWALWYYHKGEQ